MQQLCDDSHRLKKSRDLYVCSTYNRQRIISKSVDFEFESVKIVIINPAIYSAIADAVMQDENSWGISLIFTKINFNV